jgi:hypothetical protein
MDIFDSVDAGRNFATFSFKAKRWTEKIHPVGVE